MRASLTPRNPARSMDYRADRRRTRAPINSPDRGALPGERSIASVERGS